MKISRRLPSLLFLGASLSLPAWGQDADIRIAGTLSTKPLLAGIVRAMKDEKGLTLAVDAVAASADAIDAVATEKDNLAIITKPLTGEDRAGYPAVDFDAIPIGMQVVAIGVSSDVWDAGVHAISSETMRGIYERKITNWRQAGGPDEKITLFNFAQGQGVWEIFAEWLYGDNRKAPFPKVEKVTTNLDARDSLEFTPGSVAPMAAGFVDGVRCHALGIDSDGKIAKLTPEDVAARKYPIVRPLNIVLVGRPTLGIRVITEFLTGPEGQALVKKTGCLGLDAVPKPPVDSEY